MSKRGNIVTTKDDRKAIKKGERTEKDMLMDQVDWLEERFRTATESYLKARKEKEEAQKLYEEEVYTKDCIAKYLQRVLQYQVDEDIKLKNKLLVEQQAHLPKKEEIQSKLNNKKEEFENLKLYLLEEKLSISGKLSLLKELDMQRKGLLQRLDNNRNKFFNEMVDHEEALRSNAKTYTILRDRLTQESLQNVTEICQNIKLGNEEKLTYIIKRELEKSLKSFEELARLSDEGLEYQDKNFVLHHKEMFMNFEVELDASSTNYLETTTRKHLAEIQELQENCRKQEDQSRDLERVFENCKSLMSRIHKLKNNFLDIKDEYLRLLTLKSEQEKHIQRTEVLLDRRQNNNSELLACIETCRDALASHLAGTSSYSNMRGDLMYQLVTLLDIAYKWDWKKDEYKRKKEVTSKVFEDLKQKEWKDSATQSSDILTKFVKRKEFKCHL